MKKLSLFAAFLFFGIPGNSQHISKEKAIADLDFYNKTLEEVHYNPFLYVERDAYFDEVEKIKTSLKDSVEIQDFILSLYGLTALMEDSHSCPAFQQPALKEEEKKKQFFSFHLKHFKS